jgi:hypothetical protein
VEPGLVVSAEQLLTLVQELPAVALLTQALLQPPQHVGGDPYLGFAIAAGLAPPDATKVSHEEIRNRCKTSRRMCCATASLAITSR